jgi:hypothetical protein
MKRLIVLPIVLLLVLLTGSVAMADDGPAQLRIFHASPDAPAVNILVDGRVMFSQVTYGYVTHYAMLEAGDYNIKVVSADRDQLVVIDANLTLEANKRYTVSAVGTLANIEPLVLEDNTDPPEPGKAKVRAVHASPDAPAVDVAVKDGDVLFSNAPFKGVTDYQVVDAGGYSLEVRGTGTDTVVLDIPYAGFPSGSTATVVVLGLANGEPGLSFQVLVSREYYHSGWHPRPYPYSWYYSNPYCYPGYAPPSAYYYQAPRYRYTPRYSHTPRYSYPGYYYYW